MGGAAYADDWGGWLHEGRNPNSRVHPEGVGSGGVAAASMRKISPRPCGDQGDSLPSPWTPC
jgi:hypothetical protein